MTKQKPILFPIAVKLIIIITGIILISLITTTVLITNVIRSDVSITAEDNNFALNQHSASEAEIFINSIISNTTFIVNIASTMQGTVSKETADSVFSTNTSLAAVVIPGTMQLVNSTFFYSVGIESPNIQGFIKAQEASLERAKNGETVLVNASPFFNTRLLAAFMPLTHNGVETAVCALFPADSLIDTFGSGTNKAIMVNSNGDILVSADITAIQNGQNIADTPVFSLISSSNNRIRQLLFRDTDGSNYFTSFYKLLGGEVIVITQIQEEIVFESLNTATRRNVWLSLTVLFTAVLFVWFFSKTITVPIQNLTHAVTKIEASDYNQTIAINSRDELSILAKSITHMGQGLAEKERLKETFGKFINSEIAERASKGELKLGGENREVTVFFTDLRSFTDFSEKLPPEEVVAFLNTYLEIMVNCITKTGGSVDKFIGDAIMAVWGAPIGTQSAKDDALCAVMSALMMRNALIEFNKKRAALGLSPVKMGCGINSGPVIAGQIGSHERMEYTVIGDTVNFASRIESINKSLETDILISQFTYDLVKEHIIADRMPSFRIKGKEDAVNIYAVVNLIENEEAKATPDASTDRGAEDTVQNSKGIVRGADTLNGAEGIQNSADTKAGHHHEAITNADSSQNKATRAEATLPDAPHSFDANVTNGKAGTPSSDSYNAVTKTADGVAVKTLSNLRILLGNKEPDLKSVDINEEEKKYSIQD